MAAPNDPNPVLYRTKPLDANGLFVREWTRFFSDIKDLRSIAGNVIPDNSANTTGTASNVTGTVALDHGGTGATDAATARVNLSAAKSGANTDITGITGLTTPLGVLYGGTGSSSPAGALTALGGASLSANNTFTGSQTFNGGATLGAGFNLNNQTVSGDSTFTGNITLNNLGLGGTAYLNGQNINGTGVFTGDISLNIARFTNPQSIYFGSGWTTWTPTITASGGMTVGSISVSLAKYLRIGPKIDFELSINVTPGGSASNTITVSLPIACLGADSYPAACVISNGSLVPGIALLNPSTGKLDILLSGSANWTLTASYFKVSGSYMV